MQISVLNFSAILHFIGVGALTKSVTSNERLEIRGIS